MTEASPVVQDAPFADPPDERGMVEAFIERWQGVTASELSTAQSFVMDLCDLLGVDKPHATPEQAYMFERPVVFQHGDGTTSAGRIDCYRRGHFVPEAKKVRAGAHTQGFDDALLHRLVELNAKRASEEAAGTVRWLRPDFQQSETAGQQAGLDVETEEVEAPAATAPAPAIRRPWPSGLPEQIKAVAAGVLANAGQPLALDAIAANFTARGRWRDRLPTILDTLEALGRVRRLADGQSRDAVRG